MKLHLLDVFVVALHRKKHLADKLVFNINQLLAVVTFTIQFIFILLYTFEMIMSNYPLIQQETIFPWIKRSLTAVWANS